MAKRGTVSEEADRTVYSNTFKAQNFRASLDTWKQGTPDLDMPSKPAQSRRVRLVHPDRNF